MHVVVVGLTRPSIPFLERFGPAIMDGKKTCTARSKRYPLGLYDTPWGVIEIHAHDRVTQGEVRDVWWEHEGVESPAEFEAVWREIHKRAGLQVDKLVWLHHFRYLGDRETIDDEDSRPQEDPHPRDRVAAWPADHQHDLVDDAGVSHGRP